MTISTSIAEPALEVTPLHLSIRQRYESGSSQSIHLMENGDLGVILARGHGAGGNQVPSNVEDTGLVVLSLGVDGDHDEVHYSHRNGCGTEEVLTQAIEALTACREALKRIRRA